MTPDSKIAVEKLKAAALSAAVPGATYIGCGSCKGGTGWRHKWNGEGDLVPVDPPEVCPACGGMGKVKMAL